MIFIKSINELRRLDIRNYEKVLKVELDRLDLLEIPEKIFELFNLKFLNLSSNLLTSVSGNISKLTKLEEIYLNKNKLTELPNEMGELKNLRKIILSNNKIKKFPDNFYNLINLEIINIISNELEIISDDIYKLTNLEYLYLRSNQLKFISKAVSKIKDVSIYPDSYENMNNLAENCEYLQINRLKEPLKNLPITIKEIRLFLPTKVDVKLPFDCKLYIDDVLIEQSSF
jgi:Leucine-rich repeat (LRR) protein